MSSDLQKLLRKTLKQAVVFHRYLGIVFGFLILLWCLSGFVMMFVQYPSLTEQEKYHFSLPLDISQCCPASFSPSLINTEFHHFTLTQGAQDPVFKFKSDSGAVFVNAISGNEITGTNKGEIRTYANKIAHAQTATPAQYITRVDVNQWSIIPSVAKHAPFDVYALKDPTNSHLYFSQHSGELIQHVTFVERTWGWVGAVIHWIYPTIIRSNTTLWVQLVIWLSVISLFMVVIGAYIGISRLRHKNAWRKSPYRGRFYWHHYTSLFTGVLMLMWLFSGLMSMYPWGLMEGRSFEKEARRLQHNGFHLSTETAELFSTLKQLPLPEEVVELQGSVVAGYLNITATDTHGVRTFLVRLPLHDQALDAFPEVSTLARTMRPDVAVSDIDFLTAGDTYYYSHHVARKFPVYRIIYEDGERIYLDGLNYEQAAVFDSGRKTARWLYLGLHRGDFFPNLNGGLIWYLSWGGLLLLMTVAVAIGCWLSIRVWQRLMTQKRKIIA